MIVPNPVPPMTDPLGIHWSQPKADSLIWHEDHVVMSEANFNKLPEYSSSMPSGVYPGKMWKRQWRDTKGWVLMWFGIVEGKPDVCSNNYRDIIVEVPDAVQATNENQG